MNTSNSIVAAGERAKPRSGDQCPKCGFGYLLPSMYCDHCNTFWGGETAEQDHAAEMSATDVLDAVVHEVKCWPEFFEAIQDGRKTFEVRVDDRAYQVGDYLLEREFDPTDYKNGGRGYTGQGFKVLIRYIGRHIPGLPSNVAAMSITRLPGPDQDTYR